MFCTYLSVCVWALFVILRARPAAQLIPLRMLTNRLTSGKLQTLGSKCLKKTRGNSSGSTIKRSEPEQWPGALELQPSSVCQCQVQLALVSQKHTGRRQRKFSSGHGRPLCGSHVQQAARRRCGVVFLERLVTFDF